MQGFAIGDVDMGIHQSGHYGLAGDIHNPGVRVLRPAAPDRYDAFAVNYDITRDRRRTGAVDDLAALQDNGHPPSRSSLFRRLVSVN